MIYRLYNLLNIEKVTLLEGKNDELTKKYDKALVVIEKLENENIEQKEEIEELRAFKQQNKLQESKISVEYDKLLNEYKDQVKRLQQELAKTDTRYDESRNMVK